jgi:hypothetical protein
MWRIIILAGCSAVACQFDSSGAGSGSGDGDDNDGDWGGEALQRVVDPFGDGTPVAGIFEYDGRVHLGPSRTGDALVRFDEDGTSIETVTLAFAADGSGNQTSNTSPPPYAGIGYQGCTVNQDCGPDNEDGRGLFASGSLGDEEVLIVGGARSGGDLDYLYVTRDTGSVLSFSYVDLSDVMGGASKGVSALHVQDDRVYLGFSDTGGARPYFLSLTATPAAAALGIDAASGTDVDNLDADDMPDLAVAGNALIDVVADFGERVYLANAGGWMRSNVPHPAPYSDVPSDWSEITPSSDAFGDLESIATDKTSEVEPADRAVPQFASHAGRLYAARNTATGPQLWACDPAIVEPANDCDSDDWALIAVNISADAQLSQFDNPHNEAIALLVAAGPYLYVGFDNPEGLVLYRTAAAAPTSAADFEGLAGAGLGDPLNTRIFDGKAFGPDRDSMYVVVGDGLRPLELIRLPSS